MSKSIQFDFQFCLLSTDNNITIALYFVIFSFVSMPNMDNLAEYLFREKLFGMVIAGANTPTQNS